MIKAWLFLHILGFTLWIGGAIASMVAGVSAKREGREGLGVVARAQAAIQKVLIGPGALLTVLSGLMLTFRITGQTGDLVGFNLWLVLMQAAGIIGALVALLISLPTASKLARHRSRRAACGLLRRAAGAAEDDASIAGCSRWPRWWGAMVR